MPRPRIRTVSIAASLLAAAGLGAGGGAAIYRGFAPASTTKTVVKVAAAAPAQPVASRTTGLTVNQIYRRAYKGVVEITVTTASQSGGGFPFGGGSGTQQAQGSGFVYDAKGDIVTNQHVVDGATSLSVRFWNGASYTARVVGADASTDLAVIHVDAPSSLLSPLTLGDSSKLSVGDGVVAIGSPFGLQETVTSGIVSALHRQMTSPNNFSIADSIQTDAAINHGNSGGPLLGSDGAVVGVNAQIESDSGGNEGVGFAIPSSTVASVVSQLLATGTARHAYLGVSLGSIPASAASKLGLAAGAEVSQVRSGTPAAKAGLHGATGSRSVDGQSYPTGGDVITALDGKRISSAADLQSAVDAKRPGDSVSLTYVRAGKTKTVRLTLETRPS